MRRRYAPTLLEDVPDMAFKFAAYESLRSLHRRLNAGRPASVQVRPCALPYLAPWPRAVLLSGGVRVGRLLSSKCSPRGISQGPSWLGQRSRRGLVSAASHAALGALPRGSIGAHELHKRSAPSNSQWTVDRTSSAKGFDRGCSPEQALSPRRRTLRWAAAAPGSVTGGCSPNRRCLCAQEDFAMGAAAGAFAAAATTPLDVIKTRMMCTAASRPTMASAARAIAAQGGPACFFRRAPG